MRVLAALRAVVLALLCGLLLACSLDGGTTAIDDSDDLIAPLPSSKAIIVEPDDAVAFMYNQMTLRTIELELSEENLEFLDAAPADEEYVSGAVVIDGTRYDNVGIRYKGSVGAFLGCTENGTIFTLQFGGSGRKTCLKLSMKVKFSEYEEDQRFFGVKRLQFHSMKNDPSMLGERLAYAMYREMGIAAPRAAHISLKINGEIAGIFLLVEQIDGQFARSRFAEGGEGNVYKEIWPNSVIDANSYIASLRSNRDDEPSAEKFVTFADAIQANAPAAVSDWLDIDYMMRYIAVDRAIRNDDGAMKFYCPFGTFCFNHNLFWYEEVSNNKVWLIPWDMDPMFFSGFNPLELAGDWRDEDPVCEPTPPTAFVPFGTMTPACDPLFNALAGFSGSYVTKQQELLQGPYSKQRVDEKLDTWSELLRPGIIEANATDSGHIHIETWESLALAKKRVIDVSRENLAEDIAQLRN